MNTWNSKNMVSWRFIQCLINTVWGSWSLLVKLLPGGRGRAFSAHILNRLIGLPVRTVSGVKLELLPVSSADQWTANHLEGGTVIHEAMQYFLWPGGTFIDVGANIGLFSIYAAKTFGAEVLAVEPSKRERRRLERNMKMNGTDFEVIPFALGERDGEAAFEVDVEGSHLMNRIRAFDVKSGYDLVLMRRFDGVFSGVELDSIALVKIDVEGYEMAVLRGMTGMIDRMRKTTFVIEVSPQWLTENGSGSEELYYFFESRGWRALKGHGKGFQWDEIFVPPGYGS